MKDNVYLLYNTNASKIKLQKQSVKSGSFDWEYIDKDKITIMYNPEDVRKSTEIKIHSKTKLRDRPKSAGEVMMQPKINAEGILIKKSISLSNIEDFFLKRRIPLIKPLISEREILKLQLLQEQCRKKRTGIEPDKTLLQNFGVEDNDLISMYKGFYPESEEEKLKDKARVETSSLLSKNLKSREDEKRLGDKRRKESEEGRKTKTPASGKSRHEEKRLKKHVSFDKSKSGLENRKKREKQGTNKEEKVGTSKKEKQGKSKKEKQGTSNKEKTTSERTPKGEQKSGKSKGKTSSESELKTMKSDSKTKYQTNTSKSKGKNKSEEKISGEDMKHEDSDKGGTKGSSKRASKQKIKSELSEKDVLSKGASDHSKDKTSQGKKSDKSDKSESGKSRKMSDSSKKRKEKDKDVKEEEMKDKLGKMKPQSEDSQENKKVLNDAHRQSDISKRDKKTKPGTTSERNSDPLGKEKPFKTDAEVKPQKSSGGKNVKFPNVFQHIIHYVLSNPLFVKLGWTLAASDRAQLQVVTFRAVPSTPNTFCFRERAEDEIKFYSKTLEKVAFHFRMDGTGEIFYPSGVPAATITKHSTGMRLTLYSDPKNDPLISDSFNSKTLAIFDSFGNGVVYDMQGKKLLNFSQLEGIFYSPHRKSPYKWQWCDYKILDKQRLKALLRYMAKEQKQPVPTKKTAPQTSGSPKKAKSEEKKPEVDEAYEQILAELPYPIPQKTKTKSENQFWGFKPITLKINNEMTLRINGQDDVTVSFSSNQIFLRIDLGVKVDPDVVEMIEELAPKQALDVPCVFDGLLEQSPSLQQLTAGSAKGSSKNKLSII